MVAAGRLNWGTHTREADLAALPFLELAAVEVGRVAVAEDEGPGVSIRVSSTLNTRINRWPLYTYAAHMSSVQMSGLKKAAF